jgi:hypothetical protein
MILCNVKNEKLKNSCGLAICKKIKNKKTTNGWKELEKKEGGKKNNKRNFKFKKRLLKRKNLKQS